MQNQLFAIHSSKWLKWNIIRSGQLEANFVQENYSYDCNELPDCSHTRTHTLITISKPKQVKKETHKG